MSEPKYQHDCAACVFLGNVVVNDTHYDLYFHGGGRGERTVIARFSDEGSEYVSGLHAANVFPELAAAKAMAVLKGLL